VVLHLRFHKDAPERHLLAQDAGTDTRAEEIEIEPGRAHGHRPAALLQHEKHPTEIPATSRIAGQDPNRYCAAEVPFERRRHAALLDEQVAARRRNAFGGRRLRDWCDHPGMLVERIHRVEQSASGCESIAFPVNL
jgi:hypothetical protein